MQLRAIFFLLLPISLFGQREIISDSTWLQKTCVDSTCTYYEYTSTEFSDGETITKKITLGDSATAVNYLTGKAIDVNRGYAMYAALTVQKKEMMHRMSDINEALVSVGLPELFQAIQKIYESNYIGANRVVELGKEGVAGEVVKLDSGVLRLKFGANNCRVLVLSDKMIRVFSYPVQGETIDLYKVREGVFTSIDRELTIRFK